MRAAAQFLRNAMETARLARNLQQEIAAKLQLSKNAYMSGDPALAEREAREALDTARENRLEKHGRARTDQSGRRIYD